MNHFVATFRRMFAFKLEYESWEGEAEERSRRSDQVPSGADYWNEQPSRMVGVASEAAAYRLRIEASLSHRFRGVKR